MSQIQGIEPILSPIDLFAVQMLSKTSGGLNSDVPDDLYIVEVRSADSQSKINYSIEATYSDSSLYEAKLSQKLPPGHYVVTVSLYGHYEDQYTGLSPQLPGSPFFFDVVLDEPACKILPTFESLPQI